MENVQHFSCWTLTCARMSGSKKIARLLPQGQHAEYCRCNSIIPNLVLPATGTLGKPRSIYVEAVTTVGNSYTGRCCLDPPFPLHRQGGSWRETSSRTE
eukprot:3184947-Amphidinium_carterae.1